MICVVAFKHFVILAAHVVVASASVVVANRQRLRGLRLRNGRGDRSGFGSLLGRRLRFFTARSSAQHAERVHVY